LDDFKEKRGAWKLKEEALDRRVWGSCFGKGYGLAYDRLQNERMEHGEDDKICKFSLGFKSSYFLATFGTYISSTALFSKKT